MKITFLGATKTVTGSNFLVEGAGKKFLIDLGLHQGRNKEVMLNTEDFLFNIEEIDFVLLTHAHIDHSGRIPKLYKQGYRNPIYATKATVDLCGILLPDSGHIQESEAEWLTRRRKREGKHSIEPLYTAQDGIDCLELFQGVRYDEIIDIDENIKARFNDAGHMLGSSIIEIWVTENGKTEKMVFSGDIGNNDIPLLNSPTMVADADYLIMESTYGGRKHIENENKAEKFLKIVSSTLQKGGNVIIPSFAVGRTQEILYEINNIKEQQRDEEFYSEYQNLMKTDVYVDSPLAVSATEIFKRNIYLFNDETKKRIEEGDSPLEFPGLKLTQSVDESRALNELTKPSIIISASGMCEVGRIKHHLKHNLWNPNSTILFVGYQAEGTLGRRLVNGEKKVKIFGEEIVVNAQIEYIEGYSGHADQDALLNFVYSFREKPKHIFLVHGEPEGQLVLKEKIIETTGLNVAIPNYGEVYELDNTEIRGVQTLSPQEKYKYARLEILDRIETLKEEIEDMGLIVKREMLGEHVSDEEIDNIKEKLKQIEQQIVKVVDPN